MINTGSIAADHPQYPAAPPPTASAAEAEWTPGGWADVSLSLASAVLPVQEHCSPMHRVGLR